MRGDNRRRTSVFGTFMLMRTRFTQGLACLFLLSTSAAGVAAAENVKRASATVPLPPASVVAVAPDYVIGQEDVLHVDVWKEPELTRAIAVRSDGKISLPLIGDVQAAGLTPLQLKDELTKLFNGYMASAIVSVSVQESRSQRISVLGEVARPGTYPLIKPMTVLDALATAGGFKDFAKTSKMFILRIGKDGKRTRIPLKYKKVLSEKEPNDNIELQARDTIVVP